MGPTDPKHGRGESADRGLARALERLVEGMRPELPGPVVEILRLLDAPDLSMREVADALVADPLIASRILGMANAPSFRQDLPAGSVSQAMQRMGAMETRNAVLSIGVIQALSPLPQPLQATRFWSLGFAGAICARLLVSDLGPADAEQAYQAGLVRGIGEALLAISFPERFALAWREAGAGTEGLAAALKREFGVPHTYLGAHVLEQWGFAPEVVQAVRDSAEPDRLADTPVLALVVWTADWIARELGFGQQAPRVEANRWQRGLPPLMVRELHELGFTALREHFEAHPDFGREVQEQSLAALGGGESLRAVPRASAGR